MATEQYRRALRRYDPRVPYYDLIVREETDASAGRGRAREGNAVPAVSGVADQQTKRAAATEDDTVRRERIEFCHRVAAAVFETLSAGDHDDVERAVMDAYFDLAERVEDPDGLCLCLLESMARELDARLRPDQQAAVLAGAATQFPPDDERPVPATLATLRRRGLVASFSATPATIDRVGGQRSVVATLSGYALSPTDGQLPVLPMVVELYRHGPDWPPAAVRAIREEDTWRLVVEFADESVPSGLSSAPIEPA